MTESYTDMLTDWSFFSLFLLSGINAVTVFYLWEIQTLLDWMTDNMYNRSEAASNPLLDDYTQALISMYETIQQNIIMEWIQSAERIQNVLKRKCNLKEM